MWWWVLVWAVLVLAALGVLGALVWGLVRKGLAVAGDLGRAGERMAELAAQVERLPAVPRPEPAVFDDPASLRRARTERMRRARAARQRTRARTGSGATAVR